MDGADRERPTAHVDLGSDQAPIHAARQRLDGELADGQDGAVDPGDMGDADQARAGRDLRLDRQIDLSLVEGFVDADDGGFDFKDVLRGFDQQHVHAALDESDGLLAENFGEIVKGNI